MLHGVTDHANQPDCGCDRRIPAGIDYPLQLGSCDAVYITHGELVNRLMVAAEEIAARSDGRYFGGALAVTSGPLAEGQREPLPPLRPHLLDLRQIGHMIVLDSAQVPDQPRNGVRAG